MCACRGVCVCMYVCVYVCMGVCVYVRTYVCISCDIHGLQLVVHKYMNKTMKNNKTCYCFIAIYIQLVQYISLRTMVANLWEDFGFQQTDLGQDE